MIIQHGSTLIDKEKALARALKSRKKGFQYNMIIQHGSTLIDEEKQVLLNHFR